MEDSNQPDREYTEGDKRPLQHSGLIITFGENGVAEVKAEQERVRLYKPRE